jgi:hypothetical protein
LKDFPEQPFNKHRHGKSCYCQRCENELMQEFKAATYPCLGCSREIEHRNDWCDKCWDKKQDDGLGIGWGT